MAAKELQEQIEKCKNEKVKMIGLLDEKKHEVIDLAMGFFPLKMNDIITRFVKDNPDHTKSLGETRLGELKKLSTNLFANSTLMEEIFSRKRYWVHEDYDAVRDRLRNDTGGSTISSYNFAKLATDKVESGISTVLGLVGTLLSEYGYTKIIEQYVQGGVFKYNSEKETVYPYRLNIHYGLEIEKELENKKEEYSSLIREYYDLFDEHEKLSNALNRQEALDIWDKL